jgi:hypothetical protein
MNDFIWWVGIVTIIYFATKFSAWGMRKLIFKGDEKSFRHWLEDH